MGKFIVVTIKNSHYSIILSVPTILNVFEDDGGVFIVTNERKRGRRCSGYYVAEPMSVIVEKLGAV